VTRSIPDSASPDEAPSDSGDLDVAEPTWTVLRHALAPVRRRAALVLGVITAAAVLEAVGVGLIVPLIAIVLDVDDVRGVGSGVAWVQGAIEQMLPGQSLLLAVCLLIAAVYLVKAALTVLSSYLSHSFQQRLQARWTGDMLEGYLWTDYRTLLLRDRGALINNVTHETISAQKAVKFALGYVSRLLVAATIYLMMLIVNWQITLILSVIGGSIACVFWAASQRYSLAVGRRSLVLNQTLTAKAEEALRALREVKVFALERQIVESLRQKADEYARLVVQFRVLVEIPYPASELLVTVMLLSVLVAAEMTSRGGAATLLPVIAFFTISAQKVFQRGAQAFSMGMSMTRFIPSLALVDSITSSEVVTRSRLPDGAVEELARGDIELVDLTFAYNEERGPVVEGISMAIPMGSTVGILGTTGSGKSTILDLLCGLHRDYQGIISIADRDLRSIEFEHWRSGVGVVSQQPVLFRGSIRDNITLSESRDRDAGLEEVARKAHAHEFISRLPHGYDTVISDESSLSIGQKQRIAIARVIYRDPWLYLFDEATSGLDITTEGFVQEFVASLRGTKTVVIVTHRHSNVQEADNVYVLEQGRISEQGRFQDLRHLPQSVRETSPASIVIR
jgi:ABC-type bacteriocin/lantibiotic exporter with double-glycine peptidase domain